MAESTYSKIKGLEFSAVELKALSKWNDAIVEDYLNVIRGLTTIANLIDIEINQKIEEIKTDFQDGSIPYVDTGFLVEDNLRLAWNAANLLLTIGGIIDGSGRKKNTIYTSGPIYTITKYDDVIIADTDSAPVSFYLPDGVDGQTHKISNGGTSGNDLSIYPPSGIMIGGGLGVFTLFDQENLDLTYYSGIGWE